MSRANKRKAVPKHQTRHLKSLFEMLHDARAPAFTPGGSSSVAIDTSTQKPASSSENPPGTPFVKFCTTVDGQPFPSVSFSAFAEGGLRENLTWLKKKRMKTRCEVIIRNVA
jgi:hypothetical protein